ncbi:MAG: hypothetical protein QM728_02810 [Gordonia sp. (in: high G+C Gram-positive bacteria)]|uniref:hypothetical protein n=1 Tax=Gordonia sp. (in: high G+C Gram-positive bacteria) TaxID=84139 RepID=UPI0039E307E6
MAKETSTGRGPRALLIIGVAMFLIGLVSIGVLYLVPALEHGSVAPVGVYLAAMGTPFGLMLAVGALVWRGNRYNR